MDNAKIEEVPEIKSLIIEIPEPCGPFGAKEISEVATVPATAAILNAVYNACGVLTFALPLTRQELLQPLHK
jgi:CO/xanthine dehydrogenase Mo-binding subunit